VTAGSESARVRILEPAEVRHAGDPIEANPADRHPRVRRRGHDILLCTQYLEEADQLADRIALIDHGRVIAEGTPSELKPSVGSGALHVRLLDPERRPRAEEVLAAELGAVSLQADPAALTAACADAGRAAEAVAALSRSGSSWLLAAGQHPPEPSALHLVGYRHLAVVGLRGQLAGAERIAGSTAPKRAATCDETSTARCAGPARLAGRAGARPRRACRASARAASSPARIVLAARTA
jgi:hypothetical protein